MRRDVKYLNKLTDEEEHEISQKAQRAAKNELKAQTQLVASFEQYEKIESSGITDINSLQAEKSKFDASDLSTLKDQLLNYVGADGKYMPFTKSVHIKIPNENLHDIQIVDTPGVNDPVQSRETRTRELLKYCDVILIVSPSGQFISMEDTALMDRITSKEGVRHLYVVASQVDNQLGGSIKKDCKGQLHKGLDLITSQLSEHMHDTILKLRSDSPEVGTAYDQLVDNSSKRTICSSGISQSIITHWAERKECDSGITKAWSNLVKHYPDFFSDSDKELSISNLEKLANIHSIKRIIQDVRDQKKSILANRKDDFIKAKTKSLVEFQRKVSMYIDNKLETINNTDIDELRTKQCKLQEKKKETALKIDDQYDRLVREFEVEILEPLFATCNSFFKTAKKTMAEAEGSETKRWTTQGGFLWLRTDHHSRTYTTVRAGAVRDSIQDFTTQIMDRIDVDSKKIINRWREKTPNTLISTLRNAVGDELLEVNTLQYAFKSVFSKICFPDLKYRTELPENLRVSGTLTGNCADKFSDESRLYVGELNRKIKNDIKSFVTKLMNSLKNVNLSHEIFANYDSKLDDLEKQISNKKIVIELLNRLKGELKEVNGE